MFVDEADVEVVAGDGGDGCLSFRREKHVARGGPDGGDGGTGGSIFLVASTHLNTLVSFRFHPQFQAKRGSHGQGANKTGRSGKDLKVEVPIGTVVYRVTDEGPVQLADLTSAGQRVCVGQGGQGGRGNARFATATNRAPRRTESGQPGESLQLHLRLKLLADVGLVGFPNAGKSTLISRISSAKPKIANYPFTTLTPNLGVVELSDDRSFVVADVPGLIKGAHDGHGLGDRFLGHLERTKVLVHVIDVSSFSGREPSTDFDILQAELDLYSGEEKQPSALANKPRLTAANKVDVLDEPARLTHLTQHVTGHSISVFPISAVTGEGVGELLEAIWQIITTMPRDENASLSASTTE